MIEALSDCIDFYNISIRYLIRNSGFSKAICQLCADISSECATACEQLTGTCYQSCAQTCRECAEICHRITEVGSIIPVNAMLLH
ncbi:four-helix bundle copper-binding protein [Paenibacillus tianjinensis]